VAADAMTLGPPIVGAFRSPITIRTMTIIKNVRIAASKRPDCDDSVSFIFIVVMALPPSKIDPIRVKPPSL
jgi:hypothetical protein